MKFGLKLVNYLKGFDNGPVYNEKYLKIKVKSYENYVFGTVKNYYPQVFLEESKDIVKKIITLRF